LAELRPKAPSGERWVHEIKFDGYRFQLHKQDSGTKMYARRGYDWTERVTPIVRSGGKLNTHRVVLDGEVVILTPEGRSDFAALEILLPRKNPSPELRFYAFDILHLEVFDLRRWTLLDRKRVLKAFPEGIEGVIHYSEHFDAEGPELYRNACKLELEGIVSNGWTPGTSLAGAMHGPRAPAGTATRSSSPDWRRRQVNLTVSTSGSASGRRLVYAGKLERGFTDADKRRILELHARLESKASPVEAPRTFPKARWMKPDVLVEAEFRGKTGEGLLRHPAFKGIRRDVMGK
jgi:bifunctional non-homologous end joining protein LigD